MVVVFTADQIRKQIRNPRGGFVVMLEMIMNAELSFRRVFGFDFNISTPSNASNLLKGE